MTSNDYGHVKNLDVTQIEALKNCWIGLTNAISTEGSISVDQIIGSAEGDALFYSIGYDDPDVLILRWLRARKWDVDAAVQQLMDTLRWRREWDVDELIAKGEDALILEERMSDKTYFMGQDKEGRPVNYIHVREHIKDQFPVDATERLGVFSVETGRKLLGDSIETGTVVMDMSGFSMQNMDYRLVKFFIHLLESHYPESLGLALVVHAPLLFHSCWLIIKRWLDPVVESKIHFIRHNEDLLTYIDRSNIPKRLDGTHPDFKYIQPTDEDRAMLSAFRTDKQGKKSARIAHRKAARNYLNLTLKWANGDDSRRLLKERKEAAKQLRDAFEQLVPYVHTRTCYHRIGAIKEPIFDIAYEKLRIKNDLNVVEF